MSTSQTLFRWHNNIAPCSTRQKPATKLDMDKLAKEVEAYPDDYQWARAKRLNVGQPAIHYGLKRLNISYKKALLYPKANDEARVVVKLNWPQV